jgi:hypothetical protein
MVTSQTLLSVAAVTRGSVPAIGASRITREATAEGPTIVRR